MNEHWKQHDRPCPPCPDCGAELYEKFWGNGGWAKTEKGPGEHMHSPVGCVIRLKAQLARSTNYVADTETSPHVVTFVNGRVVSVNAEGSLDVGWESKSGE